MEINKWRTFNFFSFPSLVSSLSTSIPFYRFSFPFVSSSSLPPPLPHHREEGTNRELFIYPFSFLSFSPSSLPLFPSIFILYFSSFLHLLFLLLSRNTVERKQRQREDEKGIGETEAGGRKARRGRRRRKVRIVTLMNIKWGLGRRGATLRSSWAAITSWPYYLPPISPPAETPVGPPAATYDILSLCFYLSTFLSLSLSLLLRPLPLSLSPHLPTYLPTPSLPSLSLS